MLKGEFVVTDKMQDNFVKNVIPKLAGVGLKEKSHTPSVTLNIDRLMDVDKLDNSTDLKSLSKELVDEITRNLVGNYKLKFGI